MRSANDLFTKIDKSSKFYRNKLPFQLNRYAVINEGQKRLVVLYGDSHAEYSAHRLMKLYEDAEKENRLSELPTLVMITLHFALLLP